jgi:peptide/nickel transport system permease protein
VNKNKDVTKSSRKESIRKLQRFAIEQPLGVVGIILFLILIILAIGAPLFATQDPTFTNVSQNYRPPSPQHWFGTDHLGRDVWSRWLYGSRISLLVGLSAVILSSVIGGILGIFSGLTGGKVDMYLQRFMDAWMAIPSIIMAIIIMAALGSSIINVVIAIAATALPRINRLTRSTAISLKESLFVESAKIDGASKWRITLYHVAPNCVAPWLVYASALLGTTFLAEATLSFLGMGIPPPAPSWGRDISESMNRLHMAPWLAIFPGIGISMAVFAANFIGDSVRDVIDPRLKKA